MGVGRHVVNYCREEMMPQRYQAVLFGEHTMVPMRDGVELATDIYRPALDGLVVEQRLPVILHRTPYD